MSAVAEKLGAANVMGVAFEPTEPFVETSTIVLAPLIGARLVLIVAPDRSETEPLLAVMVLLFSEIAAFAPVACKIMLLPLTVDKAANEIVLLRAPGAFVFLINTVPAFDALLLPVKVTAVSSVT